MTWLLYGCTGYTGKLIVAEAVARGERPVLAGRNADRVRAVAEPHGLDWRAFDLGDPAATRAGLAGVSAVLNAAGPFEYTAAPMLAACLDTGTHYLDISGEVDTFEACAGADGRARSAGVMVMPGVAFDLVPSNCLALGLQERLPDATDLKVGLRFEGTMTRGTAKSGLLTFGYGVRARRDGRLVTLPSSPRHDFDFGDGPQKCVGITFGDVSISWRTTGIPNITCYGAGKEVERMAAIPAVVTKLFRVPFIRRALIRRFDKGPEGPAPAELETQRTYIAAEVTNAAGERRAALLRLPHMYRITADLAVEVLSRVAKGQAEPGYRTPAAMFGSDFIEQFDGCELTVRQ